MIMIEVKEETLERLKGYQKVRTIYGEVTLSVPTLVAYIVNKWIDEQKEE